MILQLRDLQLMIGSFKHRGLKRYFEKDDPRKLPTDMIRRIRAILTRLAAAERIEDMDVHEYKLHELKGARKGFWSVTVRANWRITDHTEFMVLAIQLRNSK